MPQIEQRLEKTAPPLAEDKKEAASSVLVRFTLSCSKMTGSEDKMRAMSLSRLLSSPQIITTKLEDDLLPQNLTPWCAAFGQMHFTILTNT